jgi:radical SAM protein with 4Fe4S-binding SPASM domain
MMCRFILTSGYALRGWKLLPYAIQYLYAPRTEFFREDDWALISACDGQTDIDWDALTDAQRKRYGHWEKNGFIRRAGDGERLLPHQEYRFYPARFKESVQWSITGRCNYKCRHCFMSAPRAAQGEPGWDELMTMLDAFQRCGVRNLNLTGGEPMFRRDFWELVDEIHKRGMAVPTLYSNGLLITDAFLNQLDRRHMRPSIQFSFDGVGHHDWMRGVPGAEKTVVDALRRCQERGIPASVSMVVCRESLGSIRESVNLMASLGVRSMKVGSASPQGEWKNEPEHYLTQAELYEAFLEYIPHYFEDGRPLTLGLEGFFFYDTGKEKLSALHEKNIREADFPKALMCGHVRRDMYVSPRGNVLPCMSMVGGPIEAQFPNMLETPLEDILDRDSLYMDIVNLRISDFMAHNPECRTCEYRTACCGGCRAIAVQDGSTDYLAKDPIACEYFKGGWKDKKDAVLRSIGQL